MVKLKIRIQTRNSASGDVHKKNGSEKNQLSVNSQITKYAFYKIFLNTALPKFHCKPKLNQLLTYCSGGSFWSLYCQRNLKAVIFSL